MRVWFNFEVLSGLGWIGLIGNDSESLESLGFSGLNLKSLGWGRGRERRGGERRGGERRGEEGRKGVVCVLGEWLSRWGYDIDKLR